jgi:hypothetical protein
MVYIINVSLQPFDCTVFNGRLTLVKQVVPNTPTAYGARLRSGANTVLNELLHGTAHRFIYIIGVDIRVKEKCLDGNAGDKIHNDIAARLGHEGEVDHRNIDGCVGDSIHGERDIVLRECLSPGDPRPVLDPDSQLAGRREGNTGKVEPGSIAEVQDVARTRKISGAVVHDDVRFVEDRSHGDLRIETDDLDAKTEVSRRGGEVRDTSCGV